MRHHTHTWTYRAIINIIIHVYIYIHTNMLDIPEILGNREGIWIIQIILYVHHNRYLKLESKTSDDLTLDVFDCWWQISAHSCGWRIFMNNIWWTNPGQSGVAVMEIPEEKHRTSILMAPSNGLYIYIYMYQYIYIYDIICKHKTMRWFHVYLYIYFTYIYIYIVYTYTSIKINNCMYIVLSK